MLFGLIQDIDLIKNKKGPLSVSQVYDDILNLDFNSYMIRYQFQLNVPMSDGRTPFLAYLMAKAGKTPTQVFDEDFVVVKDLTNFARYVQSFIEARADVNTTYKSTDTELSYYTYIPDFWECTPLHLAASIGDERAVKALLRAGAKVDAATVSGTTPLVWAVRNNHADVARILIDAGADVNRVLKRQTPALTDIPPAPEDLSDLNKMKDYLRDAKKVVEQVSDVINNRHFSKHTFFDEGSTVLSEAVDNRAYDCVDLLFEKGAKLANTQGRKKSEIQIAASNHDIAMMEKLIKHGADINQHSGYFNETPLFFAAHTGGKKRMQVIDWLLEHGADIDAKKDDGQTLAMYVAVLSMAALPAFYDEDEKELFLHLLEKGANINAQDEKGNTILHAAPNVGTFDFLTSLGADASIKNNAGKTPVETMPAYEREKLLERLATKGQESELKLTNHGADMSITNNADMDTDLAEGHKKFMENPATKEQEGELKSLKVVGDLYNAYMQLSEKEKALFMEEVQTKATKIASADKLKGQMIQNAHVNENA